MSQFNAIVDDRDTTFIQYRGAEWNQGGIDGEYSETTTGSTSAGAVATFSFHGTFVEIVGSFFQGQGPLNFTYTLDSDDPIAFSISDSSSRSPRQTSLLREQVPDGDHVLTVELLSPAPLHWWVDYMVFTTTTDQLPKLPKTVLAIVDDADTSLISYKGGWTAAQDPLSEIINHTEHVVSLPGSTAVFEFHGTYIAVYGSVPANTQAISTYTVDGGVPSTFTSTSRGSGLPGQKLFESNVNDGQHTLTITLTNNAEFRLDYIIYRPTVPQTTSSSASGSGSLLPSPSSSTSAHPASSSGTNAGAIAGGAVGGILGLTAIFFIVFFCLRRRRSKERYNIPSTVLPTVQPFRSSGPLTSPTTISGYTHYPSASVSGTTTTGPLTTNHSLHSFSQISERELDGGVRLMGSTNEPSSSSRELNPPAYNPNYPTRLDKSG